MIFWVKHLETEKFRIDSLISVELTNRQKNEDTPSGNQIVIRVTDTDSDTKGKLYK